MRNVTWIVRWFRLSFRLLPFALAISMGLTTASSVRASDEAEKLAPVLRVARPYPELKTPPNPTASRPRIQPAGESVETPSAPVLNLRVGDGWVARDMIGKRSPLVDPSQPQPQTVAVPSQRGDVIGGSPQTPPKAQPSAKPLGEPPELGMPIEEGSPVLSMPAAPAAPNEARPASEPAMQGLDSVQKRDVDVPAPDLPAEDAEILEVAPTASGWQSNGAQQQMPAEDIAVPLVSLVPGEPPTDSAANGPDDSAAQAASNDKGSLLSQPASNPSGSDNTEGSTELRRMLRELEGMKRVAPLKPVAPLKQPTPKQATPPNTEPPSTLAPVAQPSNPIPAAQPGPQTGSTASSVDEIQPLAPPADSDDELLDLQNQRDLDIPVRRPSIATPETLQPENASPERLPLESRGTLSKTVDPNSKARDLQEQIERFERGESDNIPQLENDVQDEALDNAAEPVPMESLNPSKSAPKLPRKLAPVISAAVQRLDQPIRQALMYYHQRPENASKRTPWGMLHAILPFGVDASVDAGRRYNAIAYLAGNNPNRNLRMLTTTGGGRLVARSGVGLQGHQAQMLAIFAQVGVPAEYPLYVQRRKFILNDLVKTEMLACKAGEELTFTLIGLSHYLPTDTKWRSADGQGWDFERLLSEEMSQPVVGAACGGTHRLMGLSYALQQRKLEGLPITGQWARAETYLSDFETYAWQLQNRDGSFSTDWFEGRADNGNLDRKIQTTGHILEWLLFITEEDALQDERVTRGVSFLASQMINERGRQWQVGPKGHALRALSLYHQRVFRSDRPWLPATGATAQQTTTKRRR